MARTPLQAEASRRSLNTARAVLRVLAYLAGCSEGATSGEVSRFLGRSSYTAYYLLNSLCQEGFAHRDRAGRYRLSAFCRDLRSRTLLSPLATLDSLHEALNELNSVTGCRAYLAVHGGQVGPPGGREETPGGGGRRGGSEGPATNYLPEHRLLA